MRRLMGLAIMGSALTVVTACTTLGDLMPFGAASGTNPESASSTTPGLAIDRKPGYPPYAMMKGTVLIAPHGAKRTDYYFWLNEKNTAKVVRYLQEENAYAGELMQHTADLQKTLRAEIRKAAGAQQGTPPFKDGDYWYYERFAPGGDYPVIARRKGSMSAEEEILVDGPAEGPKHDQFRIGGYAASPDGRFFARAADYSGDRWHTTAVTDTQTGARAGVEIKHTAADLAFASDNKTLFYLKLEPGTARAHKLMRHTIGAGGPDKVVYEEKDAQFELALRRSKGGRVLLLTAEQTTTSDVRMLDAAKPDGAWTAIRPRARGVRYFADEVGGQLYIRTNLEAPDYRIMRAALSSPSQWSEAVASQPGVYIEGFEVMGSTIALDEYARGGSRIRLHDLKSGHERYVTPDAPAGHISSGDTFSFPGLRNSDPQAAHLRYAFSSPVHADTIYDYDLASGTKREVQRNSVPGFSPPAYAIERIQAPAPDGKQIPVTLAWRRDKFQRGRNPVLVYGYGAYGSSNDPVFKSRWPSLLDRGFVLAYAHVRGGRELGEAWYEGGRLRNKKNSFTDFIAVAEHLKREVGDPKRIFAMGRSAGGLLVGAVANMRPDLFKGIVANVPFVDVVTTMLDDSIPLTTLEFEEWGNPAEAGTYAFLESYSPYDQVDKRAYPAMLVTAGFNDSQVSYFEPAKWVAKIRRNKTDTNPLIFRTNMIAGHSGDSGRFGQVEEGALIDAFLLDQAGLNSGDED